MRLKLLLISCLFAFAAFSQQNYKRDSLQVIELNLKASKLRESDPAKSFSTANQALRLAKKINFDLGMAEAYRVMGRAHMVMYLGDTSLSKYVMALALFRRHNDSLGICKVYNDIGGLYKLFDRQKALSYYYKSLAISKRKHYTEMEAGCSINIANIFTRQQKYNLALSYLNKSYEYFKSKKDSSTISLIIGSKGFLYTRLGRYLEAEEFLLRSKDMADKLNLRMRKGGINLDLALIYTAQRRFDEADKIIQEGKHLAEQDHDEKMITDFLRREHELEARRKNYYKGYYVLKELYGRDSVIFNQLQSKKFTLHQEQFDFLQKEQETKILLEKQKTNRIKYIATVIVLALSFVVIGLLIVQSRKKAKTLQKMKELNEEISIQKENLNEINQNLENIIEERTQDLQVKNLKLSQYSSHLSHEIRSPISTIKGLLLLDDEDLIDDQELIAEIRRCAEDIDNKLLNINQMLHNPQYKAFVLPEDNDFIPPSLADSDEDI